MLYDFHTHTFLSDGELSPVELVRRAAVNGYTAMAITDHVGLGDQGRVLEVLVRECAMATQEMGVTAVPGVELTHLPPRRIAQAARMARSLGARVVIVHGETIKEPVEKGTNLAALECPEVDILAHPGLLTVEEARLAAERGAFLELSARAGHSLTNGHVARVAASVGASLVVDSDAHAPHDLLTEALARQIAEGAGLAPEAIAGTLLVNPRQLLARLAPGAAPLPLV